MAFFDIWCSFCLLENGIDASKCIFCSFKCLFTIIISVLIVLLVVCNLKPFISFQLLHFGNCWCQKIDNIVWRNLITRSTTDVAFQRHGYSVFQWQQLEYSSSACWWDSAVGWWRHHNGCSVEFNSEWCSWWDGMLSRQQHPQLLKSYRNKELGKTEPVDCWYKSAVGLCLDSPQKSWRMSSAGGCSVISRDALRCC